MQAVVELDDILLPLAFLFLFSFSFVLPSKAFDPVCSFCNNTLNPLDALEVGLGMLRLVRFVCLRAITWRGFRGPVGTVDSKVLPLFRCTADFKAGLSTIVPLSQLFASILPHRLRSSSCFAIFISILDCSYSRVFGLKVCSLSLNSDSILDEAECIESEDCLGSNCWTGG